MEEKVNKSIPIIITQKFSYQTFPLNETAIEVDEETLSQIGKTKCFDVENNCVVDYDDSKRQKNEEYRVEHQELLSYLKSTDYITNKLSEAISKYIETGDNTDVIVLRATYKEQLEKRESARKRINELEELGGVK